jgi:hypothetical protein
MRDLPRGTVTLLDVYLGRVTRIHHDLDVALSRADQLALQQCITARSRGGRTSSGWPRMPHRSIPRSASGAISSVRHAIIWGRHAARVRRRHPHERARAGRN